MRVANEDASTGTTEVNKPAVENKAVADANVSNKQDTVSKETQPVKATQSTQSTQSVAKGASAPSTTYTAPATRGSVDLTAAAREAFDLINDYRTSNGYSALEWSEADAAVARVRAKELASNFSHTSASGTTTNGGENIAKSNTFASNEASIIVNGWINSPGHRANILRPNFVSAGLAVYESNGIYYWSNNFTQRMAVPGDKGTTTTKSTENGGTITVTDNNDGSVLSVGCDVIPDSEGWVTGHFEIREIEDLDVRGDGSWIVKNAKVTAATDTGITRVRFDLLTGEIVTGRSLNKESYHNMNGLRVTWNDVKNGRKFMVKVDPNTLSWGEVKWIN